MLDTLVDVHPAGGSRLLAAEVTAKGSALGPPVPLDEAHVPFEEVGIRVLPPALGALEATPKILARFALRRRGFGPVANPGALVALAAGGGRAAPEAVAVDDRLDLIVARRAEVPAARILVRRVGCPVESFGPGQRMEREAADRRGLS